MSEKKYEWFKIAESKNELRFSDDHLLVVEVNGGKITLASYSEELYACAYLCPHASGILAEGYIDALGNIVCPVHQYKFNLLNRRNTTGEGYNLKTYPVKVTHEGVFVGFEENRFWPF